MVAEEGTSSPKQGNPDIVHPDQAHAPEDALNGEDDQTESSGSVQASVVEGKSVGESLFANGENAGWLSTVPLPIRLRSRTRAYRTGFHSIHLRKTARAWAKTGRFNLNYQRMPVYRQVERLDVLWDVSGSMVDYISLYLPWLQRLAQLSKEVRVFPFGTRLDEITDALRGPRRQTYAKLADLRGLWAGGTSIGEAIQTYVDGHTKPSGLRHTTVLIVSDGWDVGRAEDIAHALRAVKQADARVYWMNPWLATPGFEPKTRALLAAKPFLVRMVAGHNRRALKTLNLR